MLSPKQKVATKSLSRRSESYQYSKIKSATVRGVSENLGFPNKRSLFEKKIRVCDRTVVPQRGKGEAYCDSSIPKVLDRKPKVSSSVALPDFDRVSVSHSSRCEPRQLGTLGSGTKRPVLGYQLGASVGAPYRRKGALPPTGVNITI